MSKYLYGAAVQGIQGFIFQTNKLKEIVGASELVEQICGTLFAKVLYNMHDQDSQKGEKAKPSPFDCLKDDPNAILNAAGNIKYIFEDEKECRRVVRVFPKEVMEFAPGITISQSVVAMTPEMSFSDAVKNLEKNLRIQRNKLVRNQNIGLNATLRSRDTGLPVTKVKYGEYLDAATYCKLYDKGQRKETFTLLCKKAFGEKALEELIEKKAKLPLDMKDMTLNNDWIAIIHADGNGLGKVVQEIGTDKDKFRDFSRRLDAATSVAAVRAFGEVMGNKVKDNGAIPMRPIVLSGDDHTVICTADLAVPYTKAFLKYFEEETKNRLGEILLGKNYNGGYGKAIFKDRSNYLTACAGIAFIKSSYPFHFGYQLAETLCDRAKKDSKALYNTLEGNLPASCLMFHKVQDSFISNYEDIAERELRPQHNISFEFGPYYLSTSDSARVKRDTTAESAGRWTIDTLIDKAETLNGKEGNAVKSHLRNWLTLLHDDPEAAKQKLDRLNSITPMKEYVRSIIEVTPSRILTGEIAQTVYPVFDILSLHTINNQTTR